MTRRRPLAPRRRPRPERDAEAAAGGIPGIVRLVQPSVVASSSPRARVLGTDDFTDLAALRVDRGGLPAAEFAEELPEVGELAIAMGNPLGLENTVTAGIVSAVNRSLPAGRAVAHPPDPDRRGDLAGQLRRRARGRLGRGDRDQRGLPAAAADRRRVAGLREPAPTVVDIVGQLVDEGRVRHPYLGVGLAPVTPQIAEAFGLAVDHGVLVQEVEPGGPADRAGARRGDIVVGFGAREIRAAEDLLAELREHEPGDAADVTVVRGGDERTLELTLGERPPDLG